MGGETQLERLIKAAAAQAAKSAKDKSASEFTKLLFEQGVEEEITSYSASDLAMMAMSARKFADKKLPGRHRVRVFNPSDAKDGWQEQATIVEILNDDMPFLVDSILSLLGELNTGLHLVLHPVLTINRKRDGGFAGLAGDMASGAPNAGRESLIHAHINLITDKSERDALEQQISKVLDDVRTTVLDWQPMRARVNEAVSFYQTNPPPVAVDELAESIQFLQWLLDNHYTFLGIREYTFEGGGGKGDLKPAASSGLGILRDPDVKVLRRGRELVTISPELREFLMQPAPLIITKANVRANVHRRVHMDYIGIKQFNEKGQLSGELRVVGLFTSAAYTRSARMIPLLRRKVGYIIENSGFGPDSHSGKALLNIVEQYPRDELFQIDADLLLETAKGILQLEERPRTRLFVRRDKFDRFVSALVYIPRDRFNTKVRIDVGNLLSDEYNGYVSIFYPAFPEGSLVRVHYIIGRTDGPTPAPDLGELEAQVVELVKTWDDRLGKAISGNFDVNETKALSNRYTNAFSGAYQEAFQPSEALRDIDLIEGLSGEGDLAIDFYREADDAAKALRLKLYHLGQPIALTDRLPILENMGLRAISEQSYQVNCEGSEKSVVWIHDIALETASGGNVKLDDLKASLEACFMAVWGGLAENDSYNTMVLKENIGWRDVTLLRAIGKYLRLGGMAFSADYMENTLIAYSGIAVRLLKLFYTRFETGGASSKARKLAEKKLVSEIETALQDVPSLDQDSILRRYVNFITSSQRTNYFQHVEDGGHKPALAIKISSREVDGLPEPKPYAEIFVYSPDVEGVHLRAGRIARGGLRWSDRPEDFRTEVLGLCQGPEGQERRHRAGWLQGRLCAQEAAAGGSRDEVFAEGTRALQTVHLQPARDYRQHDRRQDRSGPRMSCAMTTMIPIWSSPPTRAPRLSPTRQWHAIEHGFWLDDAFASGGSAGYDHKAMGITARGGWEAVKRHFREINDRYPDDTVHRRRCR